jgi:hypothetical protein
LGKRRGRRPCQACPQSRHWVRVTANGGGALRGSGQGGPCRGEATDGGWRRRRETVRGDRWRGGGEVAAREEDSEVRMAVGGGARRRGADGDRDGACQRADAAYASPTVL